jgi:hypothetical protein
MTEIKKAARVPERPFLIRRLGILLGAGELAPGIDYQ